MINRNNMRGIGRGRRSVGSFECTCPNCGHKELHKRGIPCSQEICPKCKTTMRGVNCL